MKKPFLCFLKILDFSENFPDISENCRNIYVSLHKILFSVYFRFQQVFFRVFESVKLNDLGSRSSYGNVRRPANSYEDLLLTNQIQ